MLTFFVISCKSLLTLKKIDKFSINKLVEYFIYLFKGLGIHSIKSNKTTDTIDCFIT